MPKIITHHTISSEKRTEDHKMDADSQRIQDIVIDISKTLVRDKTQLTAEVESGILDRSILEMEVIKIIDKNGYSYYNRDMLIEKVFDWMFGYGPLEKYINDPDISDIDFTRNNYCTIKINGIKEEVKEVLFSDEKTFEDYVIHIITRRGGILNYMNPHFRISDNQNRLRINGSIFPRNVTGAALQIRKHPKVSPDFNVLISKGMMTQQIANDLEKLAKSTARILIIGKGAAGKTTLFRAILNVFFPMERVLLAESDTEIYPEHPGVIAQKIKKSVEGGSPVTLQDLVNDGLTMSLDTYCVGEMVGPEAWTIITLGLNGHRWLSTAHANSVNEAFPRLLTMVKQSNVDLDDKLLYKMFSESIDIIIHMGSYKVLEISQVIGFDDLTGQPLINKIHTFNIEKIYPDGRIEGTFAKINSFKGKLAEEFERRKYQL